MRQATEEYRGHGDTALNIIKGNLFRYREFCLLGYNALFTTFFHLCFLLGLFFNPEDAGDMFLRNIG
jgi:hypothetical protein